MRNLAIATVGLLALLGSSATAELINDGGFDATASWQTDDSQNWVPGTDNPGQWYAIWWQPNTADGNTEAALSVNFTRQYSLLQVVEDGGNTNGEQTLSFDMTGNWRGYVYAVGYEAVPTLSLTSSPPAGSGLIDNGTMLLQQTALPGDHTADRVHIPLDFGTGHQVVVVAFRSYGNTTNPPTVDNVNLTPEPMSLGLLGLGAAGLLRRRRRRQLN